MIKEWYEMSFWDYSTQDNAIRIIKETAAGMPVPQFIAHEIANYKGSQVYRWMVTGREYYRGRQDILQKQRTAIGEGGKLIALGNLPNNRNIDNVYRRMVKQKTNYLVGKPFSVQTDDDAYTELLNTLIFTPEFFRQFKILGKDSLCEGVGWLYPYYDEDGSFKFKRFEPTQIIPEWLDADHTELDAVIRFYDIRELSSGGVETYRTIIEYYTLAGIDYYEMHNGQVVPYPPYHQSYIQDNSGNGFNWDELPFVPLKYNDDETPLILNCKSLQDGLNEIISTFKDRMDEDNRNTIYVIVNYDGENLGEFRRNLATYGAVKVRSQDGAGGDVRTLQVEVNAENWKAISDIFRKAIIENCMGFDSKDERMSGTPNQMNIRSMYNDIDLDASDMETEYQAGLAKLMHFVNLYLANAGYGDYTGVDVTFTFNTDLPMDESVTIANINASSGILSTETLLANHPWVDDPKAEMERLKEEHEDDYNEAFQQQQQEDDEVEDDGGDNTEETEQ